MINVCKAICVTMVLHRKAGKVCGDPATHDFGGRACCWTHLQVLASNSRPLEFEEPTPLRMAGAV